MRVLVVSNTPFLPPDAGNRQRINRMIEHLQGHRIDVGMLMLLDAEAAPFDVATMSSRLAYFEVVERPARTRLRRGIGRLARQVRRVAGRRVEPGLIGVDEWCPAWFRARTAADLTR